MYEVRQLTLMGRRRYLSALQAGWTMPSPDRALRGCSISRLLARGSSADNYGHARTAGLPAVEYR